jgi:hypothetical protein
VTLHDRSGHRCCLDRKLWLCCKKSLSELAGGSINVTLGTPFLFKLYKLLDISDLQAQLIG